MYRITTNVIVLVSVAFTMGAIVVLGLPTFALEGFCSAIHVKTGIPFAKFRQWVDFFCVGLVVILTLVFPIEWSLREGTIISMILFGPLLGIFMPRIEKLYEKWDLVDANEKYHNKKTGLQTYFLNFPDSEARLEIMSRPELSERNDKIMNEGFIHLAFSVGNKENVDKLTKRLVNDGFRCLSGPRTTGDGYYESVVEDCEGNLIEITE